MKCGIPFDVAEALDPAERLARTIAFGELEGRQWDWSIMDWSKPA